MDFMVCRQENDCKNEYDHYCNSCAQADYEYYLCQQLAAENECATLNEGEDTEDCMERVCVKEWNLYNKCAYTNCESPCPNCDDKMLAMYNCNVNSQAEGAACADK